MAQEGAVCRACCWWRWAQAQVHTRLPTACPCAPIAHSKQVCLRLLAAVPAICPSRTYGPQRPPPPDTSHPLQIKRTEGVSTTDIVGRMLMCTRDNSRFTEERVRTLWSVPMERSLQLPWLQACFRQGIGVNADVHARNLALDPGAGACIEAAAALVASMPVPGSGGACWCTRVTTHVSPKSGCVH